MTEDEVDEFRRRNDIQVAELATKFDGFVDRYERDIKRSQEDVVRLTLIIEAHDIFIRDIKPIYSRGMMALGAAALGSVGIFVHWLWGHVRFG